MSTEGEEGVWFCCVEVNVMEERTVVLGVEGLIKGCVPVSTVEKYDDIGGAVLTIVVHKQLCGRLCGGDMREIRGG